MIQRALLFPAIVAAFIVLLIAHPRAQFNGCPAGFCQPNVTGSNNASYSATANPAGIQQFTNVFTWSGVNIGSANSNRLVVLGIAYNLIGTISTVTVDYGSGPILATFATISSGSNGSDIWYVAAPTGTTATIVITLTGGGIGGVVFGAGSLLTTTAIPSHVTNTGVAGSLTEPSSVTLVVPTGGVAIATRYSNQLNPTPSLIWTNVTITPAGDGTSDDASSESQQNAHNISAGNETITINTGTNFGSMAAVSWGP